VPKRISLSFSFREREKRYQRTRGPTQSMLHHRFIQIRSLKFMFIHHRRFAFLSTLSLSSLSLSRARAKRRTNERDQKTNEGKCAHAHKTQARARKGKTESDIQVRVFSHSRLTQNERIGRWILFIIIFEIVLVKLERASPARALFMLLARISRPSPHVFFFSFLRASKMWHPKTLGAQFSSRVKQTTTLSYIRYARCLVFVERRTGCLVCRLLLLRYKNAYYFTS